MAASLLRVARADTEEPGQFVLVHVKPSSNSSNSSSSSSATNPLDLRLHATDGERAFATKRSRPPPHPTVKRSKLPTFRHKSYTGTPEELETIVSSLLLLKQPPPPASGDHNQQHPQQEHEKEQLLRGIELTAIVDDQNITLTIRKNVGGIKQKIAQFALPEADVEIPIFEWAGGACSTLETTSGQAKALQSKVETQKKEIEKLVQQLKTLTGLKKEHEETLLVKFRELLNAKKSKIRELDVALENVKKGEAAPTPSEQTPPALPPSPKPKRTATRTTRQAKPTPTTTAPTRNIRKRKPIAPPTDSDSDGGFAAMDVDKNPDSPGSGSGISKGKGKAKQTTPPPPEDKGGDETTDSAEDSEIDPEQFSDHRSTPPETDDEEELPPVRRFPGVANPDATTASTGNIAADAVPMEEDTSGAADGGEKDTNKPVGGKGRGRGGRGRGTRGRGGGGRGKGRAAKSTPPQDEDGGESGGEEDDDEL